MLACMFCSYIDIDIALFSSITSNFDSYALMVKVYSTVINPICDKMYCFDIKRATTGSFKWISFVSDVDKY